MHYWCVGYELHLFQRALTEAQNKFESKKDSESTEQNNRTEKRRGRPIKISFEDFCKLYTHEEIANWFDGIPVDADDFCKKYQIKRSTFYNLKKKMLNKDPNLSVK